MSISTDILVIGAGMTGLAAAKDLQEKGHDVLVVDKGRGLGGRLAGKRFADGVFDNGAQYVTARTPRFAALMEAWAAEGTAVPWEIDPRGEADDRLRWRGVPAMTAMAKKLAEGIEIQNSVHISSIRQEGRKWVCPIKDGTPVTADAVLMTLPVPQALDLLDEGGMRLEDRLRLRLEAIEYHRCFSVMALLEEPSGLPPSGALALDVGPVAWMADNQVKGISSVPAVTLHASPAYSLERWDKDREETARDMLHHAACWLGSSVIEHRIHGWKFSRPVSVQEEDFLVLHHAPNLLLAGDAFGGGRVEGAVISGWAAANHLLQGR